MRKYYLPILFHVLMVQLVGGQVTTPVATIPFEFRDSKIIVKLRINDSDRVLNMLFDTGADGVGMKREVADAIGLKESKKQQAQVVGATTEIVISAGNTLRFDTLKIENQSIGIFPNYTDDLDGLFGANLLRNFITEIDFDQSLINLYRFGPINYPEGGCRIPLDYNSGLPGIEAKVRLNSGKEILSHLYFDSGANYPLIFFGPGVKKYDLEKGFYARYRSTTISLGHETPTLSGPIDFIELGKFKIPNFTVTLQPYKPEMENWGLGIDGSLGIEIIGKFNCFINLPAKEYYLIPNKYFAYPADFWLGNIQFGFCADQIIVKHILPNVNGTNPENQLKEKDIIVSINDKTAVDFLDSNTFLQIQKDYSTGGIEMIVNRKESEFKTTITGN